MNSDPNNTPFFGTQGFPQYERKARTAGEYHRRHPVEYDPHYLRYGKVLFKWF